MVWCDIACDGPVSFANPKVEDLHEVGIAAARNQEDVVGFEIAVNDPACACAADRPSASCQRDVRVARGIDSAPTCFKRSPSEKPSSSSMTMKLSPSGVCPKSCTSTMFSWPIWVTARASVEEARDHFLVRRQLGMDDLERDAFADDRMVGEKDVACIAPEPIFWA